MTIPHASLSSLRSSRQTTAASSKLWFGLLVVAVTMLLSASTAEAQPEPILSFEGRVTSVSPREMLVAAEREGVVVDVVMVDLARIPQSETRQIAQDDIVVVVGFIRRPGHKVVATSVQPVSRWFPQLQRGCDQGPDPSRRIAPESVVRNALGHPIRPRRPSTLRRSWSKSGV